MRWTQRPDETSGPLGAVAAAYRRVLSATGSVQEFSLTGFDRTGVPVVGAVWEPAGGGPDAHGVGYGADLDAATIGALGELTERVLMGPAVAGLPRRRTSYGELVGALGAAAVVDPRTLTLGAGPYDADAVREWVPVVRWRTGEEVWLPVEFVASEPLAPDPARATPPLITPITNGLGAGDTAARAVGHALLELLQRDGDTVSFRAVDLGRVVDLPALERTDPGVAAVTAALRAAGLQPTVKVAATAPVWVVYAVAADPAEDADPMALSAIGEAAHPDPATAVTKALLELASSRARRSFAFGPLDRVRRLLPDYWAAERRRPLGAQEPRALAAMARWAALDAPAMRALLAPGFERHVETVALPPAGTTAADPAALLDLLLGRLDGFDVLVLTSDPQAEMVAAKVVVPGLEVETLSYCRIGERVAARLLGRAPGEPGADLVGRGRPTRPGQLPVVLTEAAAERLGGPVWLDVAAVDRTVGELYPLYREPRRHAVGRLAADRSAP